MAMVWFWIEVRLPNNYIKGKINYYVAIGFLYFRGTNIGIQHDRKKELGRIYADSL